MPHSDSVEVRMEIPPHENGINRKASRAARRNPQAKSRYKKNVRSRKASKAARRNPQAKSRHKKTSEAERLQKRQVVIRRRNPWSHEIDFLQQPFLPMV